MLLATVDPGNPSLAGNLNFHRSELILHGAESEGSKLALTPAVGRAVLSAQETLVATTSDLADMAHSDILDEHGRIFELQRVVNTELSMLIRSHRIDIVIVSHEAGVGVTARNLPNRDVVGAEFWEGIHLISGQLDAET